MNQRATAAKRGTEKCPARKPVSRHSEIRPISKLVNQIPDTNVQGFGNSQESIHRNRAMSVFQEGKENDRQGSFFSQFFLGHFQPFAMCANGLSQNAAVYWNRRHTQYKQAERENNIYYSINLSCTFSGERVKKLKIGVRKNGSGPRMGASRFMKKKKRVLVVESEIPTAMRVTALLTQSGFNVQVATKAKKGMEIAQREKLDLIILEANLAGISSFEILEDLRQRHISYRTPVIFLFDQNEHGQRALSLGADDAIQKPFDAEDFISRVLSAVEEIEMA